MPCSVEGCGKKQFGRGLCAMHYFRERRSQSKIETKAAPVDGRSACCDHAVVDGPVHDIGSKYCGRCKQPCCWRSTKPLKTVWPKLKINRWSLSALRRLEEIEKVERSKTVGERTTLVPAEFIDPRDGFPVTEVPRPVAMTSALLDVDECLTE